MNYRIPGFGVLDIEDVVMDFNGTIAVDGHLLEGIADRIGRLSELARVHVLTSDTQQTAARELAGLPLTLDIYDTENAGAEKRRYVEAIGASRCACIGNGRNDVSMFQAAALSICVLETEGACTHALTCADLVVRAGIDALDMLLVDKRLASGLRG